MSKLELLQKVRFGERIAEEELNELEQYFVATDQWNRMYAGEVDIVYGSKGAGKSAIYALIDRKQDELFDRSIIVRNAENIRGNTAFSDLIVSPPPTERAFLDLWKLYFLILCASTLRTYDIKTKNSAELIAALEKAELLPLDASLSQYFKQAKRQIWAYIFPEIESVEWTITIDAGSGIPLPVRKTSYARGGIPSEAERVVDIPLDDLISKANLALSEAGYTLWILFDRLDVAFNDTPEVERNALRALFRMYNDFKGFDFIKLKIFVRDDIWNRISEGGFAEASHITKTAKIEWSYESLINLFVRRFLNNEGVPQYLNVNPAEVVEDFELQQEILERIFPDQVETGNNPETFRWMTNRIQDASGKPAPRELIHILESIRQEQVARLERGEDEPPEQILFDRPVFKLALKEVSKVRYEQTYIAENPSLKNFTDSLKGQKAEHTLDSLAQIWSVDVENAKEISDRLVVSGFFEKRDAQEITYWVPFVYRDALELVQGKQVLA